MRSLACSLDEKSGTTGTRDAWGLTTFGVDVAWGPDGAGARVGHLPMNAGLCGCEKPGWVTRRPWGAACLTTGGARRGGGAPGRGAVGGGGGGG